MSERELVDLREKVKEVIKEYEGRALDEKDQRELYKKIKQVKGFCKVEQLKTVYKACLFCGFDTDYHSSVNQAWKVLIIYSDRQTHKKGYIDYLEKEIEYKKVTLSEIKGSIKYFEEHLQQVRSM